MDLWKCVVCAVFDKVDSWYKLPLLYNGLSKDERFDWQLNGSGLMIKVFLQPIIDYNDEVLCCTMTLSCSFLMRCFIYPYSSSGCKNIIVCICEYVVECLQLREGSSGHAAFQSDTLATRQQQHDPRSGTLHTHNTQQFNCSLSRVLRVSLYYSCVF